MIISVFIIANCSYFIWFITISLIITILLNIKIIILLNHYHSITHLIFLLLTPPIIQYLNLNPCSLHYYVINLIYSWAYTSKNSPQQHCSFSPIYSALVYRLVYIFYYAHIRKTISYYYKCTCSSYCLADVFTILLVLVVVEIVGFMLYLFIIYESMSKLNYLFSILWYYSLYVFSFYFSIYITYNMYIISNFLSMIENVLQID